MIFVFILILWAVVAVTGLVLLVFSGTRWAGIYVLAISTGATVLSVLASVFGLFAAKALTELLCSNDLQLLLLAGGYFGGLLLGGSLGALIGLVIVGWRHVATLRALKLGNPSS